MLQFKYNIFYLFILWFDLNGLSDLLRLLWSWWLTILNLLLWQKVWLRSRKFSIAKWIFWRRCWDFHNNIGWLSHNIRFETFLGVSSICNSSDKSIGINDWVTAFDYISIAYLFALLIICELIIFYIKTKLIRWISLF